MAEPGTAGPRVGVSLVIYRERPDRLHQVLDALDAQSAPPAAVLIHINGGEPGVVAAVNALVDARAGVPTTVTSSPNIGFSGGHNRALAAMFGESIDAIVVHNPDLELAPDALARLAEADRGFGGQALLGPLLERASVDGTPTGLIDSAGIVWTASARHLDGLAGQPLGHAPSAPTAVPGLTGACLWVPRRAYERVQAAMGEFFDADFVAYREDADLGLVCEALGVEQWLVPAATGRHVRLQRGTTRGQNAFVDQLGVQNRFLLAVKHGRRRPGRPPLPQLRDLTVIVGVVARERSSWPGLRTAWRLRGKMRAKRHRLDVARSSLQAQ